MRVEPTQMNDPFHQQQEISQHRDGVSFRGTVKLTAVWQGASPRPTTHLVITSRSRVLCEKLTVAQEAKGFHVLYVTRSLFTVRKTAATEAIPETPNSNRHLINQLLNMHFKIILQCTSTLRNDLFEFPD
jgi:hypothetical protein